MQVVETHRKIEKYVGANVIENAPKVSIITPAYKIAEYIAETLDSVFAQTFEDYEIIVINDGSPDTTKFERVLQPYLDKIVYLKQSNKGAAAARNAAIEHARGGLLAFLDGDDVWQPSFLQSQIEFLETNDLDLVYSDAILFGGSPMDGQLFTKNAPSVGTVNFESILDLHCNIITSGVLTKKRNVVEAGKFDVDWLRAHDFALWLKMARNKTRIGYQKQVLLKYRVRLDSLSGDSMQRVEREIESYRHVKKQFELNDAQKLIIENQLTRLNAELEIERGKVLLLREEFTAARNAFDKANEYRRSNRLRAIIFLIKFAPRLLLKLYRLRRPTEIDFTAENARPLIESSDKMENNTTSLKSQSAWLLFAKVVGFAISFLLPLLVVRYFSQEQVGVYRQVFLVITTANAILPLGFGASAFYFLSRETARRPSVIANTFVFNFIIGAAACLTLYFYPQLLGNIFQSDELTRLAPQVGVVIWFWIFSTFLETVAIANREAKTATALIILAQLTKTVFMVTAVIIFTTVESFIYAAMAQALLQSIVLLVYANSRFPTFWKAFDLRFLREQIFYALPFGLAGLFWTLQYDLHNYFVAHRFTPAEFAVYAYGCFELPLIGMLMESVTAVLIPRMSELQSQNDKPEMIRLLTRTMQKLAFFYFPIYVFLMITAETFITTLFTHNYSASVPIFMINITLIPLYILVNDAVIRAHKELGRFLLVMRVFIFIAMVSALYFGIQHFDLRGMIGIVVVTTIVERLISVAVVIKKIGAGRRDLYLLKDVGKIALTSIFAGFFTYLFYWQLQQIIFDWSANAIKTVFPLPKDSLVDFLAGGTVLALCAFIFAPLYLLSANFLGVIETSEKEKIRGFWRKVLRRSVEPMPLTSEK